MRRVSRIVLAGLLMMVLATSVAMAGSPHFVGQISVTRDGNTLTVSGKEAGLGNETQVHIVVTAYAECINPGNNHPQADNKESFSAEGDFPVQNGKALFSLMLTATFQPDCTPPMTLVFSDVTVSDAAHGLSVTFPGPF
jgi:hypothetical protein